MYSGAPLLKEIRVLLFVLSMVHTQLQSLLEGVQSTSPAAGSDDVICYRGERSSPSAEEKEFNYNATPSLSLSFDLHLSAIRTPEIVSTPLSAVEQTNDTESNCSFHCRPREEEVGSEEDQCSSSGSRGIIAEEVQVECVRVSPLYGGKVSFSSSSRDTSNVGQSSPSPRDGDIDGWTSTEDGNSLSSEKAATQQPSSTSADTSGVDSKRCMPSFNLDDVNDGFGVDCDSEKDCVDVDRRDRGEGTARKDKSKECVRVRVKQEMEESESHDSHVISWDSSDDDDDKLEKCKFSRINNHQCFYVTCVCTSFTVFSDMKIRSSKKVAPKHVSSRKR